MSRNIWESDDEDFRDNPVEMVDGKWAEDQSGALPPNAREIRRQAVAAAAPVEAEEVEEDLSHIEAPDDEEEDYTSILSDARLRLEQGKLYELIMNHDLFDGMDADARAIKSVQKEIRKFAQDRMEVMLGMKEEAKPETLHVKFPFNSLEVEVLKRLAHTATKGATDHAEEYEQEVTKVVEVPKKKHFTPIGGATSKPLTPKPVSKPVFKTPAPAPKAPAKKLPAAPAAPVARKARKVMVQGEEIEVSADEMNYKPLNKPIHEMTEKELIERNKQAAKRQSGKKAAKSDGALPQPTFEQQHFLAQQQALGAGQTPGVSRLMDTIKVLNHKANQMKAAGK